MERRRHIVGTSPAARVRILVGRPSDVNWIGSVRWAGIVEGWHGIRGKDDGHGKGGDDLVTPLAPIQVGFGSTLV